MELGSQVSVGHWSPALQVENVDFRTEILQTSDAFWPGFRSDSGVDVSHTRSLGVPAVWQAVNIWAGAFAQMHVQLMRKRVVNGKPKVDPVTNHNGGKVAKNRSVSREMDNGAIVDVCAFRSTMMNHALIPGDGFAHIQRNGAGEPLQTSLLLPKPITRVVMTDKGQIRIATKVIDSRGQLEDKELKPIDVFQIMNLSHDGLQGYPFELLAKDALGLNLATFKYGGKSFANGTKLSGALTDPGSPGDDQIRSNLARWYAAYGGLDNTNKVAYLSGGTSFAPFSMSNIDAQLVEMFNQSPKIVASLFNLPPFLLGVMESSGLKFAELIIWFLRFPLAQWICVWAQQMRSKLLTEREWEQDELFFDFDISQFLAATFPEHVDTLVKAVGGPIMTRDEGRVRIKLNPATKNDKFLERSTGAPQEAQDAEAESTDEGQLSTEQMENVLRRYLMTTARNLTHWEAQKLGNTQTKLEILGLYSEAGELRAKLSEVFSESTVLNYCDIRRKEVLDYFEKHGRGAVETDAKNYKPRGLKLCAMELGVETNGHANATAE